MAYPRTSGEVEQIAVHMYQRGLSLRATGRVVGLSQEGVAKILRRRGVRRRPAGGNDGTKPIPDVAGLYAMRREHGTWKRVAEVLGVAQKTVFRHLSGEH
jgi:hypothetical protein